MKLNFRPLTAEEIECRIGTVKEGKGVSLLLYKDARCDQNILDETVGAMNWKKHYELIDGQLFCTIEIWDGDKNQWVSKQDVGTESNTEAEKGRASDAQKRAAVAFGIGRELYTAPFIWIPGADKKDKFWVSEMEVSDRKITKLTICRCNEYGDKLDEVVYSYPVKTAGRAKDKPKTTKKNDPVEPDEKKPKVDADKMPRVERIKSIYKGDALAKLLDKYGAPDLYLLTVDQMDDIIKRYEDWKGANG